MRHMIVLIVCWFAVGSFASVVVAESPSVLRFTLELNGAAVKDGQTGLIWEQEPDREHDGCVEPFQ